MFDWDAVRRTRDAEHDEPPHMRPVPGNSGEGAIYSPEFLERKEGNRLGASSGYWRRMFVPEGI